MNEPAELNRGADPASSDADVAGRIAPIAFQNVIGSSAAMRRAISLGCKVAAHPTTTVLVQGETGTGKELFARGIHYSSTNAAEPFVAINCAAIPEHLLESELFGHEKGSFTGADSLKRGLLEFAGGGTVFLDEIGEMPGSLQAKLLRALEEKTVRRVGGLREIEIACRVIAATNRDLTDIVSTGQFRGDLYYRLSVFRLELPALREREGDVELLARHFADSICREHGARPKRLAPETLELLRRYTWPGNVRELKNAIEGALIVCDGDVIRPDHIPVRTRTLTNLASQQSQTAIEEDVIRIPPTGMKLEDAERKLLSATLRLANFNQSAAARMLGVSRPTIVRMMEKYGLKTRKSFISE